MSVNPKDKAALQGMWESSRQASTADIPDGTYQFVILSARFHLSANGKPQFKTKVRVKGGAEEYIGKEFEVNDNLETPENMGWFKRKLTRLNIALPDDFEEVTDGTLGAQMEGKVFEGQVKTKNDFMNVYVNRLLGESKESELPEEPTGEEPEEGIAPEESPFEEGATVSWPGHTGEIVEVLDDGILRVKDHEDGKTYRVPQAKAKIVEPEGEPEAEAETNGEETALPTPDEAESLPATEVRKVLKLLGIDAGRIKQPRAVLHGIATLAADYGAKIELTEIAPMADALKVAIKKGTPPKDALKALSRAVKQLIEA